MTRVCSRCSVEKPLDADHFRRHPRRGFFWGYCLICESAARRERYQQTRERTLEVCRAYRVANRERRRADNQRRRDEYPEREREIQRRYYEAHREQRAERTARYRKTEMGRAVSQATFRRRRARKLAASAESPEIMREWERQVLAERLCFYCGERAATELEHMVPLSRGGTHTRANTVGACGPCNRAKAASIYPDEWPKELAA